ncbi:MAG: AmmeMemoRadiSam system protein A [Verrucomicrobia bacterium]|nr:AmmeMemoRadiSam system protein A [Verrucomicrobiota bacterium]
MSDTVSIACSGAWDPGLTPSDAATLLQLAWDTVRWQVEGRVGAFDWSRYSVSSALQVPYATFVTLYRNAQLRGCIGALDAGQSVFRSVHANAMKAATEDPRFPALIDSEFDGLTMHVSVLSPAESLVSLSEFRVGEQGIIFASGAGRAVFLPGVAKAQGWTREDTARHLCRKIGLAEDAWRQGGSFQVFNTVEIKSA